MSAKEGQKHDTDLVTRRKALTHDKDEHPPLAALWEGLRQPDSRQCHSSLYHICTTE